MNQSTTALAHTTSRRRPTIRARAQIVFTRALVDRYGYPTPEATKHTWIVLAGLPAGADVTVIVGTVARHPCHRLLQQVLALMDGGELNFEGDALSVAEWVAAAREMTS